MTATVTDQYLSQFAELERGNSNGSPEIQALRRQAIDRFRDVGLPTARRGNEAWKYTNVGPLARLPLRRDGASSRQALATSTLRRLAPWDREWLTLVFVNGTFAPGASSPLPSANGARIANLGEILASDASQVEPYLDRYYRAPLDGFAALNTAFLQDGALLHIGRDCHLEQTIHLLYVTMGKAATASHPRTLIVADANSRLRVLESHVTMGSAPHFTNAVTEISVGRGAVVQHYRALLQHPNAYHVGRTLVRQEADSRFVSTAMAQGSAMARQDLEVTLAEPGASCELLGLYLAADGQHIDNQTMIDHAAPHTTSREYYKGILSGSSRGVFNGAVIVRKDAQHTSAEQGNRNLLLSRQAEIDTKPSLAILADDVRCSHGATVGHLDDQALFYLMSRGMDETAARSLLVAAFAGEIVDAIDLEPLRRRFHRLVANLVSTMPANGAL